MKAIVIFLIIVVVFFGVIHIYDVIACRFFNIHLPKLKDELESENSVFEATSRCTICGRSIRKHNGRWICDDDDDDD